MMYLVTTYHYRITLYTPVGIVRYEKRQPKLPLHLLKYMVPSECVECN